MTTPSQSHDWYEKSPDAAINALNTSIGQGLSTAKVQDRLAVYGKNVIEEGQGRSNWEILLDHFKKVMLLMLIAAAIISGILDIIQLRGEGLADGSIPFKDTIAIFAIVILNGVLGYLQESRAEKALAALKKLASPQVQVIREGKRQEVNADSLVPGDIVLLEAGGQLCADGLLLDAFNLSIRESALTGEAHPAEKQINPTGLAADTSLGDRQNMVFAGTEVIQGRGTAVVTNTGMATELGKIAAML